MDTTTADRVNSATGELKDPLHKYGDRQPGFVDIGANFIEIVAGWAWEAAHKSLVSGAVAISPLVAAEIALDDAVMAQIQINKASAAQVVALAELFAVARAHPDVYLTREGLEDRDPIGFAERAVAFDAGLRLKLTPDHVRNRAYEGLVLAESLPKLWAVFQAGQTGYAQAAAAVQHLVGLTDPVAIAEYDCKLAARAHALTADSFRQKARKLAERLRAESPELRHTRALTDRRVVFEYVDDGMAWIHAYLPAVEVVCIKRRLDAEAKKIAKKEAGIAAKAGIGAGPHRTRDQIRADRFGDVLTGKGTPNAVKVRVILQVPLLELLEGSDESRLMLDNLKIADSSESHPEGHETLEVHSEDRPGRPNLHRRSAALEGYGPIDPVTAAQLFCDAPSFRRVLTDPLIGEILNFDRRRYRPTKAQREYVAMKYGTCAVEGCNRLAATCDLDHLQEWVRDHGFTNIDNLIPLCPGHHRLKTLTKIRFNRDYDGAITVTTPTGTVSRKTPSKPLPDNPPF